MVTALLFALGCAQAPIEFTHQWVGQGWIHNDPSIGGKPIGNDDGKPRWFIEESENQSPPWAKPQNPACVPLFHISLGNVDQHIAMGGSAPDTVLAWSNTGDILAIGTFLGELILVNGWTGEILQRKQFAETMVKQVVWGPGDRTLFIAEQSPDGTLLSLDAQTLNENWRLDLADWVDHSPLPVGNLYGSYTLPAAYGLDLLSDGSLMVTATHAWNDRNGTRLNKSILLKIGQDGKLKAQWPDQPLDAVFFRPRLSESIALLPTSKSSKGPASEHAPVGGLLVFDTETFRPISAFTVPPLTPWFTQSFIWEALDLKDNALFLGLADGRAGLWSFDGEPIQALPSSTPIMAGTVPVVASIGSGFFLGQNAVYQISTTHIPFGTAATDLQPPAAHPEENSIVYASSSGSRLWKWSGPHALQGITRSAVPNQIIVGSGSRKSDTRKDLFGALVFDFEPRAESIGGPRLERFCRTAGPVFFRSASTRDGRIAVTEHPVQLGEHPAHGEYQATVFR